MRYHATQSGKEALEFMDLVDEVYNLALNEGAIKVPLTEEERVKWFNAIQEAKDEAYQHPVYKNCNCK